MPLQFAVPYGLPEHVPGVPAYATSFWLSDTKPRLLPVIVMRGGLLLSVLSCS